MRNESSIEIDRPIDEVFKLTLDHVTEWSIIVVEDEVIDEKQGGGVGTTFRTVTQEKGRRMEFLGTVTKHDPPNLSAIHLAGDIFDLDVEYVFEDLGGRTRVTQHSSVRGKGFFKFFLACFGWTMKKSSCDATNNELKSLKAFCESYQAAVY